MKKTCIAVLAAALIGSASVYAQNIAVAAEIPAADASLALAAEDDLSKFNEAVAHSDIDLGTIENVTIFAPVDSALSDASAIENPADYIVAGAITAEELASTTTLTALSGKELSVTVDESGEILINGAALDLSASESLADGTVVINRLEAVFSDTVRS